MAGLVLKNIGKVYQGGVRAVTDFNLKIKDKEFIILVGPSGCGKSTTLRMIAGLEEITEGELYIDERLVNDIAPKDRDIAMVFQNYALYPHMTVFENMAFGLKLRKVSKEEIKRRAGVGRAVCAMTGGLDSGVSALLAYRALGPNLKCIFVDTGLLREREAEDFLAYYRDTAGLNIIRVSARGRFLDALRGVTDPNEKRGIIGGLILSQGRIEMNCALDTLAALHRSELAGEAAGLLFD